MAWPSFTELARAQRRLRRYDNALRLRFAMQTPATVLIERKTFPGRIGATMFNGEDYLPDSGYRREHGHVHVGALPCYAFDYTNLRESLQAADTWRRSRAFSLGDDLTAREASEKERKQRVQTDMMRYRASSLFDRYVWKYKQRVSVPVDIR